MLSPSRLLGALALGSLTVAKGGQVANIQLMELSAAPQAKTLALTKTLLNNL